MLKVPKDKTIMVLFGDGYVKILPGLSKWDYIQVRMLKYEGPK